MLDAVCRATGMGFAAIARVTDSQWIACGVHDEINFGLKPGGELKLETTICNEIRKTNEPVVISDVDTDSRYAGHPTAEMYGFKSYVSVPIILPSGRFFGTLCALDPEPHDIAGPEILRLFEMFGALVALQLDQADRLSEHLITSQTMRESEARHRQILDSAIDYAIIATDIDGRITRWNKGADQILGWTETEMLGQSADRIFTPEDRDGGRIAEEMRAARETGSGTDEGWHLKKNGERFWASGSMTPLIDNAGEVVGYIKVLRDRTDERRQEQRLALLAQVAAGLLDAHDPDDVLGPVLEQSTDLLGFDESYSYVLTPDCEHLHLTHSVGASDEVRATLVEASFDLPICGIVVQTGEPVIIDNLQQTTEPRYEVGRACGYDAFAAFPVKAGGKIHGVMSFAARSRSSFDGEALAFFATLARYVAVVRARLESEMALKEAADTLERRVEERTGELRQSQEALQQAQKMEAVGQLTGGVAHDFNNLLTVIRGSIDLLRRPDVSESRRTRYLDAIADTADRATKLTAQLLAFARRQSLQPEVFNVGEALQKIDTMVGTLTGSRVKIVTELAADPCLVRADPSQFDTTIVNLAINARDAMDGEGTLTISVTAVDGIPPVREKPATDGAFIAIMVRDTGTGIDPALVDRIFEPFFTTKAIGKGTGLGLSQVFGFARQSGGEIRVESAPGSGTTFTLYLPQAEQEGRNIEPDETEDLIKGHGLRVLLVEDNADVGNFATQALEELGYITVWAPDAKSALDELEQAAEPFDLVFSDVVMPGMSGIELGQEIRRRYANLPVVLTSGYSHVLAENGTYGFNLLHKPYSIEQLSKMLRKAAAWKPQA